MSGNHTDTSSDLGSGSRFPDDRARSELDWLMIWYGKRNPFVAKHLQQALAHVRERGLDLTAAECRTVVKEAKEVSLGHALLTAAQEGDAQKVQKLIDEGASVNFRDPRTGATALHYAAAFRARPAVRVLIKSGKCDYLVRDGSGRLSWELASVADDPALARLLIAKSAKQARERNMPFRRREQTKRSQRFS